MVAGGILIQTLPGAGSNDLIEFAELLARDALERDLRVMGRTAFTLCMENDMPIMVFDMFLAGNMERAVRGEAIGTWVT